MIFALFPNTKKPQSLSFAKKVSEYLKGKNAKVVAEDDVVDELGAKPLSTVASSAVNFIVTFGGDGTILRRLHRHPTLQAPVIGINLGSLGFLADIPVDQIFPSLDKVLSGNYNIQERLVLEGVHEKGESSFAVNDIVIHRAHVPSLIDLAIYVDGNYLNTFSADGLIIATASGSTAYSLAAGGPIVTPTLDALVLTPICPHSLSNRPIVLMPKEEILIHYSSEYESIEIAFDGMTPFSMHSGETLRVVKSKTKKFRLVELKGHDYFATLRSKLGWTGKLRIPSDRQSNNL
jgi:NAD+ kinase